MTRASMPSPGGLWTLLHRWCVGLLIVAFVLLSATVAAILFYPPVLDKARPAAQSWLSEKLERPVSLGDLTWGWSGGLTLGADEVRIGKQDLRLQRIRLGLRPWGLLRDGRPVRGVEIEGLQLELRRDPQGRIWVGGNLLDPRSHRLLITLSRLEHLRVTGGTLTWIDQASPKPTRFRIRHARMDLRRGREQHQIRLEGRLGGGRLALKGRIKDLGGGVDNWGLDLRARASRVALDPLSGYLGDKAPEEVGSRFSGRVTIEGRYGEGLNATGRIRAEKGRWAWSRYLREPVEELEMGGRFRLQGRTEGFRVALREVQLKSEGLTLTGRMEFRSGSDGSGPRIQGRIQMGEARVAKLGPLYRLRALPPKTAAWLESALKGGRLKEARARFRGPVDQLPFPGRSGRVRIDADLEGVQLAYHPDWPGIRDLGGELSLDRETLTFEVRRGEIMGAGIGSLSGAIRDLGEGPARLRLNGEMRLGLERGLRFMEASPLGEPGFLDPLQPSGPAHLRLGLEVPLEEEEGPSVQGRLALKGARLGVLPRIPDLKGIRGEVAFQGGQVRGKDLRARWLDQDFQVQLQRDAGGAVHCSLSGTCPAPALREALQPLGAHSALAQRIGGDLGLHMGVSWKPEDRAVTIEADLAEASIDLPEPLTKRTGEAGEAQVRIDLEPERRVTGDLTYGGHHLRVEARPGTGNGGGYGLALGLGREAPTTRSGQWRVAGQMERIRLDRWWSLIAGSSPGMDQPPSFQGELTIDRVLWGEQDWGRLEVGGRGRFHEGHYRVEGELAGPRARGQLQWLHGEQRPDRIRVDLDELAIPEPDSWGTGAEENGRVGRVPDLDVRVQAKEVEVGEQPLQDLRIRAKLGPDRWDLPRLEVRNEDSRLRLQGNWVGKLERTLMRADLETEDFGALLREMGIYPSMKGGSGTLTGTLSWPGQPQTFQAGDLSGSLRLAMANGEIEELFFLSKALSTLNVLDWPSQAVRGFDSLTHSGLVYRELEGRLILQEGMAQLEEWRLVGAPLRLRARGQMDLGKRTFDLLFRLEPLQTMDKVVSAVPLLGHLLTGEGGNLTALHYRVRGPWEEPEVSATSDPRGELPWETLWRRMREMEWRDLLPGG